MSACKPLDKQEIEAMLETFSGQTEIRNTALLVLGVLTGFRASELLALRVVDVICRGRIKDAVTVSRSRMKGRRAARSVPLPPAAKACIASLLALLRMRGRFHNDAFLFQSRKGKNCAITREHLCHILRRAADTAIVAGQVGSHSMRKTFARGTHHELGLQQRKGVMVDPLVAVSRALGHRNLQSTASYLPTADRHIEDAIIAHGNIINFDLLSKKLASKEKKYASKATR